MIRKQWLKSVYHLGPHPFLRVGALLLPVLVLEFVSPIIFLSGWWAWSDSARWRSAFKGTWKSVALFLHKLTDASFNLQSPTVVSLSALFILHSLFSHFSHIETCDGHSLVRCPSTLPYQKGWPPLIWRSLIILCRTGGPFNPAPPPLTEQATALPSTPIPHGVIKFQWL